MFALVTCIALAVYTMTGDFKLLRDTPSELRGRFREPWAYVPTPPPFF